MGYYIVGFAMKLRKRTFRKNCFSAKTVMREIVDVFVNIMRHRKQKVNKQDIYMKLIDFEENVFNIATMQMLLSKILKWKTNSQYFVRNM